MYCLSPQPYLALAIAFPTFWAPFGVLAFSTNFKVLIAPAIVEGLARLEVGTFVETHTVGVESASAATGVDSAGVVYPEESVDPG